MQEDAVDTGLLEQATAQSGAVVMGRWLIDVVNVSSGTTGPPARRREQRP
jgi:hypothetical protein